MDDFLVEIARSSGVEINHHYRRSLLILGEDFGKLRIDTDIDMPIHEGTIDSIWTIVPLNLFMF